jgi:hypothetical protein
MQKRDHFSAESLRRTAERAKFRQEQARKKKLAKEDRSIQRMVERGSETLYQNCLKEMRRAARSGSTSVSVSATGPYGEELERSAEFRSAIQCAGIVAERLRKEKGVKAEVKVREERPFGSDPMFDTTRHFVNINVSF